MHSRCLLRCPEDDPLGERVQHGPILVQIPLRIGELLNKVMGVLGIDFGSCTSERSADYILSLPGSAPEYMNEVSFRVAPGVVPPLSVSYPSLHFKVCCRGVAV